MTSDLKTKLSRFLGRNALFVARWLISRLPYSVFKFFLSCFIIVGRPLLMNKKGLVMENLHIAFSGEKSEQEIKKIAEDYFKNFGLGMIELIYFIDRPGEVFKKVSIQGKDNLDKVLSQGKGAILLSAHMGNFILMYLRMAMEGYKTNCIMRRVRDSQFEEYISKFRDENGIQTIYSLPPRQCVVKSLKCLRDNQILFIMLDQNYGDDGRVFVDFFGKPAATATGPVVFSQRSQAPILPVFIVRDGIDGYKIMIDPPVELETVSPQEAEQGAQQVLVRNVSLLTKVIQKYICLYPQEWGGWMHRRWKSKRTAGE